MQQNKVATQLSSGALREWLALSVCPANVLRLMEKHNVPLGENAQAPLENVSKFWRQQLPAFSEKALQATQRWLEESENHSIVTFACPHYPELLKEISRPPQLLFCAGDLTLLNRPMVGVVGSRRASPYGLEQTSLLSRGLAEAGWGICSGMAMGNDGAAHRAALDAGTGTVAVLGCGVDICYPPRQRNLYQQLQQHGLVVSEFYPGMKARGDHFLRRNRIISGLSVAVLVSEAGLRSGSLVTARYALEQNRSLFVVPGPITQNSFMGNHQLIRQGAALVTSAKEILEDLPALQPAATIDFSASCPDIEVDEFKALSSAAKTSETKTSLANPKMLANVGFDTTSIDSLVARTRLPVAEVMNQLINLELDGWVTAVPGGYVRVRRE